MSFAKQLPSFAKTTVLESKYKDLLAQQFLKGMRNPQSNRDRQMRKRATVLFDRDMRRNNQAAFSKIEKRVIFWKSLQGYARLFAEEYVAQYAHSPQALQAKILGTSSDRQIENTSSVANPELIQQQESRNEQSPPQASLKKPLTREEIINQHTSIEQFNQDIELEFQATYIEKTALKNNRQVLEEQWKAATQSATDPFMKIYNEALLKKVELFKSRQRLEKQKKKTRERDQSLDR